MTGDQQAHDGTISALTDGWSLKHSHDNHYWIVDPNGTSAAMLDKHAEVLLALVAEREAQRALVAQMSAWLIRYAPPAVVMEVSELPDYTSPEDNPNLLMCTADELHSIVAGVVADVISTSGDAAAALAELTALRAALTAVEKPEGAG